jgi:GH25 family lysozyme M1 (1,4-beta-N-acetylmuramidase)
VGLRLAIAAAALVLVAPASAATYAQGIDVSHYQGTISWTQVVSASVSFAFVKATEGTSITDVTYPLNRAGATSVGIPVGAYHFARPNGSGDPAIIADAIGEADYFLNVAQPQPGELPPVLDLEVNGGLKPTDLLTWTSAWLDEVYARTGVRAFVYTSPNFWKTSLADTGTVALNGYPLWIAHWTDGAAPLVPAANWGNHGWTFWQWSSKSRVAGINTAVDADRFKGIEPTAAAIQRYPAGPPVVSAPPTVVGTAQTGRRLTAVRGAWSGGKPVTFTYQWQRCDAAGQGCAPIPGAISLTYAPAADDVGHALAVAVTAQATGGLATSVSPATAAVVNAGGAAARPAVTASPALTGSAVVGQALSASAGAWTGAPTSFAYQWQRCTGTTPTCVAIVNATASTYTLTPDDIGTTLKVLVTATGRGGSTSAPSAPTAGVAAAPIPTPVPRTLVAAAGAAGAVSSTDATATATWQPGAVPVGSTVTFDRTGQAYTFAVDPTVAQLPWPVDVGFAAATSDVVGYSLDGRVYRPAAKLPTAALPPTQQAGVYVDASGLTHVLLREPARVQLFTPGAWGDPTLNAAGIPKPWVVGRVRAVRHGGAVAVTARVIVPSQALLTVNVPGKTSARRTRLQRPGATTIRVAIASRKLAPKAYATLRVAARDPYGRTAALVARFRAP